MKHRIHDLHVLNYPFAACNMYPKSLKDECSKTSTSNMTETFTQDLENHQEISGNYSTCNSLIFVDKHCYFFHIVKTCASYFITLLGTSSLV